VGPGPAATAQSQPANLLLLLPHYLPSPPRLRLSPLLSPFPHHLSRPPRLTSSEGGDATRQAAAAPAERAREEGRAGGREGRNADVFQGVLPRRLLPPPLLLLRTHGTAPALVPLPRPLWVLPVSSYAISRRAFGSGLAGGDALARPIDRRRLQPLRRERFSRTNDAGAFAIRSLGSRDFTGCSVVPLFPCVELVSAICFPELYDWLL
jgi:hypothetical protein